MQITATRAKFIPDTIARRRESKPAALVPMFHMGMHTYLSGASKSIAAQVVQQNNFACVLVQNTVITRRVGDLLAAHWCESILSATLQPTYAFPCRSWQREQGRLGSG